MAYVNIGQILYPVGAVYASTQKTSPSNIFGGTWSQITNAALRGATSIGYTGSDTCTLTVNQMPSHSHNMKYGSSLYAENGNFALVDRKMSPDGFNEIFRNPIALQSTGGGQHIQLCNAPTTVLCGIAPLNKSGDVEWPTSTLHKLCIQWEQFIKAVQQLVHQVSLVEHGPHLMIIDSGYQAIHLDQLVENGIISYPKKKCQDIITMLLIMVQEYGQIHICIKLMLILVIYGLCPRVEAQILCKCLPLQLVDKMWDIITCHLIEPVTLGEEQPNIFYNRGDA